MRNLLKKRNLLMATVAAGLGIAAAPAVAGTWVAAVPVSGSQAMTVFGINNNNILTGSYVDASGLTHGVVGPFDGSKYKSFDDPDGTTQPRALNDKLYITGFDTGTLATWERNPTGTLKAVTKSGTPLTEIAQGLNKSNIFAANYFDSNGNSIGYLGTKYKYMSKIKLSITNSGWAGRAINTAGDIAGWYYDSSFIQHGYLIVGGTAVKVDYPGAAYTVMEGLNDKGIASGQYQDASGVIHGFLYNVSKKSYKSLSAPGASLTQVWGINNNGVVAASTDVGSFAYCIHTTGCPGGKDAAVRAPQHAVGKYVPAKP